jgi:hypothetical protein
VRQQEESIENSSFVRGVLDTVVRFERFVAKVQKTEQSLVALIRICEEAVYDFRRLKSF